jgi:hypothetical protein
MPLLRGALVCRLTFSSIPAIEIKRVIGPLAAKKVVAVAVKYKLNFLK